MKNPLEFATVDGIVYVGESKDLLILKETDDSYQVNIKGYPLKYLVDNENALKIMEHKGDHKI